MYLFILKSLYLNLVFIVKELYVLIKGVILIIVISVLSVNCCNFLLRVMIKSSVV